ncbi:hypothetical protein SARC_08198 [Sphaeroforma arctica JP610]|uniref:Uncharacterized protein n=1 Tax=Sphaeroforma arctica JP610 TaxID=667725 RepID=A0A0L0FRU2_9EUKA|nr:hypothetical protein SARC_08198 [Sphaeroforma arctica JP610]KNC79409.1 hypothetical protein SARC_08198 [Sphaeroforma arctica JP610]|eukprot:XP_014153311.1 hypothetical protein SARC_08198 [Sphaeroforma arctica JP610]
MQASTQKVALVAPKVVRAISTEQIEGLSKQARRVEVQESKRALILANQEKKNAEKQLRHAKNALAKQNDELEALEHQLMDQEAKHQEAIRNLESDNKELKADNTHAHEVYLQLRDSYEAHKVDMATLQATCDRTKGELEEAQQKLTESQNKMEQHRQDAKAQLKALNETRKRADNCGTCTSLRSEVLNLRKSAEELKAESDAAIEKVTLELRVRTDELAAVVVQRDQTESSDTLDVSSERVRQLERDNENLSRQLSAMTEMWESNKTLVEHIKDTSPVHGRELNEDQRMLVDRLSEALSTLGLEGDAEERYNLMDKSMNLLSLIPQYTPYTLRALVRRFSATFIKTISGTVPSLAIEENLSWVYEDEQPVAMKQERLTEMSVGDIDFVDGTKIAAKVV